MDLQISRSRLNAEDTDRESSVKYIECLLKVPRTYASCGWLYNCSTSREPGARYGGSCQREPTRGLRRNNTSEALYKLKVMM